MRKHLPLALLALLSLPYLLLATEAQAKDTLIETVNTSTTSASTAAFDCGVQIAVRCASADASYRICDTKTDGTTCTALTTDLRLAQTTIYDISVPAPSSSAAQCKVAFITASGSGTCSVYRVTPRTLPSNLE
ncbi:MAG: hypothetical protein SFW67_28540 [Myxococcaceae bacterium]|nr:hypothetical protein [Myxococcaceae bacterium]